MNPRHFLTLMDLSAGELAALIDRAMELKRELRGGAINDCLHNRTLALIFDKSSTRTRVSFETAMVQFGGNAIFLAPGSTQLGRGEPIADTARVMSRMVDAVVIRTSSHTMVETFAEHSRVPVINGLTDDYHPCQLLADIQTFTEQRGTIRGRRVAWVGDGNNMCHSWMNAARQFDFQLRIATPDNYRPNARLLRDTADHTTWYGEPMKAVIDADIVVTDTWASMGQEDEREQREAAFAGFRVDERMMDAAGAEAVFMHCLPAYRGSEVTADVLDGPRSLVWEQAENRLHAQKALLEFLLT